MITSLAKGVLGFAIVVLASAWAGEAYGQAPAGGAPAQSTRLASDSGVVHTLAGVVVTAFEQHKRLADQPAPLAYLSGTQLARYGGESPLSALNAVPGVRMEQRSPGSYRLNIRGSSLRSPFGVRNVKIYYNGVPLTDPGGNTYLNQLSEADYGSLEVIKGPAGSLYGAGTGGAVLITSPLFTPGEPDTSMARLTLGGGSYGERKADGAVRWGSKNQASEFRYGHFQTDGYRDHTAMRSDVASYETRVRVSDRQQLGAFFHYADVYYQTPGALTLAEFSKDPRMARPAAGGYPSADDSKAAVYQKGFFSGLTSDYRISGAADNTTVLYGAYTDFINPTTRNYEYRKEPHFGGRTVFHFHGGDETEGRSLWVGAEAQQGFFSVQDFGNTAGRPDTLQTETRINDFAGLLFAQGELTFGRGWDVSGGISLYHETLGFTGLYPSPVTRFDKRYHEVLSPRIALSRKVAPGILVYANVSRGFSPPSVSEILPSTTVLNTALQAEEGLDYELGSKGTLAGGRLYYDGNLFLMTLHQTITVRRDTSGADYFVNAGSALEKGAELSANYILYRAPGGFLTEADLWGSFSWLDFRYRHYLSDGKDYSGHRVPGAAPLTVAAGLDLVSRPGLRMHLTWQHTGKIALDDANSQYGKAYDLLGARLSYDLALGARTGLRLSVEGDNLLNETYSLGNDINAAAGRYYNAAAKRNMQVEAGFHFLLARLPGR